MALGAVLSAAALLLSFAPSARAGMTTIVFCNDTPDDMKVFETYSYHNVDGKAWKERGAYGLPRESCRRIPRPVLVDQWIGYAFVGEVAGASRNLMFSMSNTFTRNDEVDSDFMCADVEQGFGLAPRAAEEIGRDCPDGYERLRFSFWYHEPARFSIRENIVRFRIEEYGTRDFAENRETEAERSDIERRRRARNRPANSNYLGNLGRSLDSATIAANTYALDEDAIGVVLDYVTDGREYVPADFGQAIVDKLVSLGEEAMFFVGTSDRSTPGYTVHFQYGNGGSKVMQLNELKDHIEAVVGEKRRLRARSQAIIDALTR